MLLTGVIQAKVRSNNTQITQSRDHDYNKYDDDVNEASIMVTEVVSLFLLGIFNDYLLTMQVKMR
jgi:hypothetical protein